MYDEFNDFNNKLNDQEPDGNNDQNYSAYQFSDIVVPAKEDKKKKKPSFFKKLVKNVAWALLFGIVAGIGFQTINIVADVVTPDNSIESVTVPGTGSEDYETGEDLASAQTIATTPATPVTTVTDVSEVVEAVMPSVVSITNIGTQTVSDLFGQRGTYENESSGSGIIIGENDTELLIVTNNHVVTGADTITVTFIDDTTINAQVKGTDPDIDLAVIAIPLSDIPEATSSQIKIAVLGDSSNLTVGEPAIAIGNALGYGQSVTTGVISALDREVTVENVTNSLIQTDAAINPGNSGGALLNMQGEVIGINAVKFASSQVEGMGYAIPVSSATPIINELMNKETRVKVDTVDSSYLGIAGVDVTEEVAANYNMPIGVYIAQVVEGSAAESAGLITGDIITAFDGNTVTSMSGLQEQMKYYAAGTVVDIEVQSSENGQYIGKVISVTLGKKTEVNQ